MPSFSELSSAVTLDWKGAMLVTWFILLKFTALLTSIGKMPDLLDWPEEGLLEIVYFLDAAEMVVSHPSLASQVS